MEDPLDTKHFHETAPCWVQIQNYFEHQQKQMSNKEKLEKFDAHPNILKSKIHLSHQYDFKNRQNRYTLASINIKIE